MAVDMMARDLAALRQNLSPAAKPSTPCPLLKRLGDCLAAFFRACRSLEVSRACRRRCQNLFDRPHYRGGGIGLTQMLQHHRGGPDLANRVGYALPGNVRRRAVYRFEQRRVLALGIDEIG